MRKIGRDVSAAEYWKNEGTEYHAVITNNYHQHRLGVVRDLIQPFHGSAVLDVGCGDGVMLADFPAARCIGIEPDEGLLGVARQKFPKAEFSLGSVEQMDAIAAESVDLVLCLNVLAYMTDAEDERFYRQAHRVLRPAGSLVVTHSNELFDLFTLNAYTADFFKHQFGCDIASMLQHPDKPEEPTYNVRENPLAYGAKLARYGFREERQGFINYHEKPPLLGKDREHYRDTLAVPEAERWKLMFQCSTFGSRAIRL